MDQRKHNPDHDFDLDDPLGIAREPVSSEPSERMHGSDDEATVRRRRARAGLDGHGHDGDRPATPDQRDRDGATGIDMGYGGSGTDVKP